MENSSIINNWKSLSSPFFVLNVSLNILKIWYLESLQNIQGTVQDFLSFGGVSSLQTLLNGLPV